MSEVLRLSAPAKLNLMLHVTGRRDDGYHLLETVFQFIDLCDRLEFRLGDDSRIRREPGGTPIAAADDILVRAASLLQARYEVRQGVSITVEKRIPIGGGLGGGSSDAATCLLALNRLWGLGLALDELAATGLEIGADVPVFVRGRAAWASGIGEQLQSIELDEPVYVVIDPGVAVSTAQIFAAQELTRNCDPLTIRAFLRGSGTNVCEPVVRNRYPEVGAAIDWLGRYGDARMSGSGACVFTVFDSLELAEEVKSRVPKKWTGFVARAMNRNPVHRQLGLQE
ncbi:MAG: 4-(cytidine 5'-diphospho)-2-C-methyl-D-erythritol kinase [Gammaproteobacteria bacterium]|nr:4-(cytidine 5'-diphospho)-2-C-methyl-D-erythritol kinase [Gammaproteobacteria bacterium]MDH3446546.1 4-(cytidine 5'-diphospho)-2-C-methyl-D-erythritol kinase [Gammaproteobacteria bacterium]